jgi:anaerobic selenocysteine-containing dehydrogenase
LAVHKRVVRSSCRMCHGVCQVLVHLEGDRVVKVTGDPDSPISRGYICPKGAASPELLYHPDRLLYPMRRKGERGENRWERISWDDALDEMAARLGRIKDESGAEYFALLQGTGRPYTGHTTRFTLAFGSPNFTGVGHICYVPRWMASLSTLGQLPICDIYGFGGKYPACFVLWGCNITETGSSDGLCGGMVQRAINRAEKLIVVDPRRIKPAEKADHWLQLRPGTDGALALAMINVIIAEDLIDHEFVDNYTVGYDRLAEHVKPFTPDWAAVITGLQAEDIGSAARMYATTSPACILWGNAIDMSSCNAQTARSLLILKGLTGNIDRPGGNVLWVSPEGVKQGSPFMNPERIGFQFISADQMGKALDYRRFPLCPTIHPPTFWQSIVSGDPYRLRALWIMGSNPLLTMTQPLRVEKALRLLEYIVVSDFFLTPTAQLADLVLPAATWLEQDDIANIHKIWCVLLRKKLVSLGEVRDDREVIFELANRLGLEEAFPWPDFRSYLEWILEDAGMNFDEACEKGILAGEMRYYKYREDGFSTPSGKFELYSSGLEALGVSPLPLYREPPLSPLASPQFADDYPFVLTTGSKIREFFHSEGRQISSLRSANPDPLLEIHPDSAAAIDIEDGDWVWVETPQDRIRMRASVTKRIAVGVVNAQHGWWFPEDDPPEHGWKKSNINLLLGTADFDPDTGSEPLRSALCRIYRV